MVFIPNYPSLQGGSHTNEHSLTPKITLVGAGPGDPDLITVKGLKAIQTADVILYDALVDKRLLEEADSLCECIYVGKRAGKHYSSQDKINELLVSKAKEKGHAVRLKGGDPFVFGRGYEELEFATQHGVPVMVIPGVSSCISVAGLQHVPMTSRGINESFWVVTATTRTGELSKDLALAMQSSATIAILMGIRKIDQISERFVTLGKGETPCMVVQNGSGQDERCVVAPVKNIGEAIRNANIGSPGIIIVGNVVRLHPDWPYDSSPSNSSSLTSHQQEKNCDTKSLISHFPKTA